MLLDILKINIEIWQNPGALHNCPDLSRSLNEWFDISLNANINCLAN